MTRDKVIQAVRDSTPPKFVEDYLFDRIPVLFREDRALFVGWKRSLAEALEVDPASLTVVGGAAAGVSLNPEKNFKMFDEASDVDVAVVSHHHFTIAWRYLRMNSTRRLHVDKKTRRAWDEHVRRYIYWGTIATDRLLGVLPFGARWLTACAEASSLEPVADRTVNLRVYADFDSLRAYQINSVRVLRDSLEGS